MASSCCCEFWRYSISSISSRSFNLKYLTTTIARAGSPNANRAMTMTASAGISRPIRFDDMTTIRSRPVGISLPWPFAFHRLAVYLAAKGGAVEGITPELVVAFTLLVVAAAPLGLLFLLPPHQLRGEGWEK